jgi:hypothetical protein
MGRGVVVDLGVVYYLLGQSGDALSNGDPHVCCSKKREQRAGGRGGVAVFAVDMLLLRRRIKLKCRVHGKGTGRGGVQ